MKMTGKILSAQRKTLSITNPKSRDIELNQSLHRVRNEQPTASGMAQFPPS